jgi:hypothetical protein
MKEKILDERQLERITNNNWLHEFNFKAAIEALQLEGLPTDLAFIQKITATDDAFKNYVIDLQRRRLSGGFVPRDEREMVIKAFSDLYDRLADKISALRSSLNSGLVLKEEAGTVAIDREAMREKQEKQATITIDVKKAKEWHAKLLPVIEAWKELSKYEKDSGLIETTQLQFHELIPFGWYIAKEGTVSEDTFVNVLKSWLKKK